MKSAKRICIYPMRGKESLEKKSPYIYHLCEAILPHFEIVNYGKNDGFSIRSLFKYFFQSDIFMFNWIENVAGKQRYLLVPLLFLIKLFGKRIIWTHHNIHPHRAKSHGPNFTMNFMIRYADIVITHTSESQRHLNKRRGEIFNFFHPFFVNNILPKEKTDQAEIQYDLLIWGTYRESKGIDKFLDHLKNKNLHYKVLMAGQFNTDSLYREYIEKYGDSITILNMYLEDKDLLKFHHSSRYIFFAYTGSSVLNSGALIRSLPYGTPIIGPDVGGFKELGESGYILNYKSFDDIDNILKNNEIPSNLDQMNDLISKYNWSNFGIELASSIQRL